MSVDRKAILSVGTKSILFGVHQFFWHPITVILAWIELYGFPNLKELVCIFVHDLGYWGCPNMDGDEGELHPFFGAHFANRWLDPSHQGWGFPGTYMHLCLFHSRTLAKLHRAEPTKLCWADKLSIKYDPWWFYLLRARLSGELDEYMSDAIKHGFIDKNATRREWFVWARERGIRAGYSMSPKTAYELEQKI
jgi:hypothetical protein